MYSLSISQHLVPQALIGLASFPTQCLSQGRKQEGQGPAGLASLFQLLTGPCRVRTEVPLLSGCQMGTSIQNSSLVSRPLYLTASNIETPHARNLSATQGCLQLSA